MASRRGGLVQTAVLAAAVVWALACLPGVAASWGDRQPDFRECVDVCERENCAPGQATPLALHLRLLLWDCPSECDQTCQRIISGRRLAAGLPVAQYHGKWPFYRLWGIQEPASVLFSLGNLWAHVHGLRRLRRHIAPTYPLRPYYLGFAAVGIASWVFSAVFHTRDFVLTERLDYFAAGASVLYGFYYTPICIFRWDRRRRDDPRGDPDFLLALWTSVCVALYIAHVAYLTLVRWDYGYNMAANVVLGTAQNLLWTAHSWRTWRRTRRAWAVWPGLAVAWVTLAMSLELFDFAPLYSVLDAHSLWHAGTIGPTLLWYHFLIEDYRDDTAKERTRERAKERLKD